MYLLSKQCTIKKKATKNATLHNHSLIILKVKIQHTWCDKVRINHRQNSKHNSLQLRVGTRQLGPCTMGQQQSICLSNLHFQAQSFPSHTELPPAGLGTHSLETEADSPPK